MSPLASVGKMTAPEINAQRITVRPAQDGNTIETPWKFLARITSRRPSARAQVNSAGNETVPKALESKIAHMPEPPPSSTVTARPPRDGDDSVDQGSGASSDERGDDEIARGIEPPIDSEETQTNAADEADQAEVNSPAPESAGSTKSQSKPRIDRRERRKRGNAHVAGHSVHQGGQPSSSRNLFLREVTMLEEEIKILTTQLNQKLHLQNTQPKKMLERFEDS